MKDWTYMKDLRIWMPRHLYIITMS